MTLAAQSGAAPRRRYGVEESWFPLLDELGFRGLRDALITSGMTPRVASMVVWFIDDQQTLSRYQDPATRVRYRKILLGLDRAKVAATGVRAKAE